jgi:hypothetical protein
MTRLIRALAAAASLLCASAHAVNIGGIDIPAGSIFGVAQIYENNTATVGSVLSGYGKIDSLNSQSVSSLCSGCELTYTFGGYTVVSVSPSEIRFSGGWLNVYLGFGADNDFSTLNPGGAAGDLAEASNGTLFLSLIGHAVDGAGNTLVGTGVGIGTASPAGFASGLLDVDTSTGALANAYFNTNGIGASFGGPADVQLGSSFTAQSPVYPADCPGGAACLRGSANISASVVPEPSTTALLLAGVGAVLGLARRRLRH